ncbi:MAG: hypothetical protein KF864_00045 [Phycisphaeraceae bacterium]|nr:hypothetical protein [Phycisphaeraceae bacterium]
MKPALPAAIGAGLLAGSLATAQPTMTVIGQPGSTFSPRFVHADGSLAGSATGAWSGEVPATWSAQNGVSVLAVPSGSSGGAVLGASDNHAVAVGYSFASGVIPAAVRWSNGTPAYLGTNLANASGVSGDGTVVTGHSVTFGGPARAFRWTEGGGALDLGTIGGFSSSWGSAISHDGSTIVGECGSIFTSGPRQAFRWTAADGMQPLVAPSPFWPSTMATAVSADGSVIAGRAEVGDFSGESERGLFRWTSSGGMQYLGTLAPQPGAFDYEVFAQAMSASGDVIVGYTEDYSSPPFSMQRAVYWSGDTGLVDLTGHLAGLGLNLGPYRLLSADAVSPDGRTIAGLATTDGFDAVGYVVTNVPAPGAAVLLAFGAPTVRRRRP